MRLGPYNLRLSLSVSVVIWMFLDSKSLLVVCSQWCRGKLAPVRMTNLGRIKQFMIYFLVFKGKTNEVHVLLL